MLEPIYTVEEVAKSLKIHPVSVTRFCRTGRIAASKTNGKTGRYRISESAIRAYLEERNQQQKG